MKLLTPKKRPVKHRKCLQSQRGSAIAWSMIIGLLLLILTASLLTVSLSYEKRSLKSSLKKQAYYTARSAVDMIADQFIGHSRSAEQLFSYLQDKSACPSQKWEVDALPFTDDHPEMGSCSLKVLLQKKTYLTITAHAVRSDEECTLTLTLVGIPIETSSDSASSDEEEPEGWDFSDLSWEVKSYSESVPDLSTSSSSE